jgi:basic membrane protein A
MLANIKPGSIKRRSLRHGSVAGVASLGAAALLLTGCGPAPEAGSPTATASDYSGCIVSDSGGFDDQSFNQSSYEGLKKAEKDLGIKVQQVESKTNNDFEPNLRAMVSAGCDLTVTVGFLLGDATKKQAEANPDSHFAIIDFGYEKPIANVKPIIYDTAQAAFMAGYLAAATSKTGTVATFGGIKIPTVTIFMDGFADGVKYYNEQKGKDVKLLGWDKAKQMAASLATSRSRTRVSSSPRTSWTRARTLSCPSPARSARVPALP